MSSPKTLLDDGHKNNHMRVSNILCLVYSVIMKTRLPSSTITSISISWWLYFSKFRTNRQNQGAIS